MTKEALNITDATYGEMSGHGNHFRQESGKHERFTKLIAGTVILSLQRTRSVLQQQLHIHEQIEKQLETVGNDNAPDSFG